MRVKRNDEMQATCVLYILNFEIRSNDLVAARPYGPTRLLRPIYGVDISCQKFTTSRAAAEAASLCSRINRPH